MAKKNDAQKTLVYLTAVQVLLVLVIAYQVNTISDALAGGVTAPAPSPDVAEAEEPAPTADASADDDAVKGEEDAPVEIIEFSDFQCPFCARFFTDTLPQLEEQYIKTGKVKLVYRDFPLSFHPQAQPAAEAAECAGEQGKFWEMHDKIFENQASLANGVYSNWAGELGLDVADFDECVNSGRMAAEVQKDFNDGQSYGVRGTPAFFINGKMISGAQPFQVFKQVIDAELAK